MEKIEVLSLSWGVQSFMLACLMIQEEIPMADVAITADTGFERSDTYEIQKQYTDIFRSKGLDVHVAEDLKARDKFKNSNQLFIPAYTKGGRTGKGHMMRTCTQRWKIVPIMRKLRELYGKDYKADMILGITTDEAIRMKPSRIKRITNKYPLVEMGFSRNQCKAWLEVNDYPIPVKSSCVFCPYHSREHWHDIRKNKKDWKEAVKNDNRIRNKIDGVECYVHRDRVALEDMPEQPSLLGDYMSECEGYCFL